MYELEFKVMIKGHKVPWNDVPVIHKVTLRYWLNRNEAEQVGHRLSMWFMEYLPMVLVVRWNYKDSYQGHYHDRGDFNRYLKRYDTRVECTPNSLGIYIIESG